jgi:glycosyltransferase involved in cell wall biosynthesis
MPSTSPTVSVIIPTYNRAQLVRRALYSVLHQTYRNIEVIIVDDCSTDDTEIVVTSFRDSRVRYIRHEINRGAAMARNTGINAASSEFIAFQDSDDEWLCDKLEKQMKKFDQVGLKVGVVYTGFLRIKENHAVYFPRKEIKKSGDVLVSLLNENFVTTQAAVVRKECFKKIGLFDEQLPRLQDWDLFIRIAKYYQFICIDEPCLIAFHSAISISADDRIFPIALKIILDKHQDVFCRNDNILAKAYYALGMAICASGDMAGSIYFYRSLRLNPWRLICWIRWISTLPGSRFYRIASKAIDRVRFIL